MPSEAIKQSKAGGVFTKIRRSAFWIDHNTSVSSAENHAPETAGRWKQGYSTSSMLCFPVSLPGKQAIAIHMCIFQTHTKKKKKSTQQMLWATPLPKVYGGWSNILKKRTTS